MAKIQPAVQTLHYRLTGSTRAGYIDLAQSLSIANRRFYRQGMQWAVSGISLYNGSALTGRILVEKLPTTWPVSSAWHKAFAMWDKQQREAVEDAGAQSAVARFRDFKVFADLTHQQSFTAGQQNLLPQTSALLGSGGSSDPLTGEWEYSRIVLPNTLNVDGTSSTQPTTEPVEYYMHMIGANRTGQSKGVVDGYQSSRGYPQSPDPVSPELDNADNWMRQMFNVGNDNAEILDNATDTNDNLPYDQENYPGSENQFPNLALHDMIDITGTTIGGQSNIQGGIFPCGLLKIYKENFDESNPPVDNTNNVLDILVHMVPGGNRGYLAEPMQDM